MTAFLYVYISIMGLLYYLVYYYIFGINIMTYYTLSDYFLSGVRQPFLLLTSLLILLGYLFVRFRRLISQAIFGISQFTFSPSDHPDAFREVEIMKLKLQGWKIEKTQTDQVIATAPSIKTEFCLEIIELIRGRGLKLALILSLLLLPLSGAASGYFMKYLSRDHVIIWTTNQNVQSNPLILLGSTQNFFFFCENRKVIVYPTGEIKRFTYL